MIDLEFIKQLKKLDLLAKRKVISSYAGVKRSVRHGRGIEPVDHREYFPGDDLRFVDWKAYARTERLFLKRYEEDKSLTTHILVDSSNSMNFGSKRVKKSDFAAMLALGFAYLVTKENERFSLATYSADLKDVLRPMRGRAQFFRAVELLNRQVLGGNTNLDAAANKYASLIKSRSLCVVISDFLEPIDGIKEGILHLAKRSRNLLVIHVTDPVEKRLDWQGDIKLYDLETKAIKHMFLSPSARKDYAVRFIAHIEKVREVCDEVGADFFSVSSDEQLFDIFFAITNLTARGHKSDR